MKIISFTKLLIQWIFDLWELQHWSLEVYKQDSNFWDNYLIIGNNKTEKFEKLIKKTIIKLLYGIIIF
jgi:hypothetical protein